MRRAARPAVAARSSWPSCTVAGRRVAAAAMTRCAAVVVVGAVVVVVVLTVVVDAARSSAERATVMSLPGPAVTAVSLPERPMNSAGISATVIATFTSNHARRSVLDKRDPYS
jgi:hypothetical protein